MKLNKLGLVLLVIPAGTMLMAGCAKQQEDDAAPSASSSASAQAGAGKSAPTYAVKSQPARKPMRQ